MPRQQPALDQLDRDVLLELLVGALGEEHLAHAALTEAAQNAVGPTRWPAGIRRRLVRRRSDRSSSLEPRLPRLQMLDGLARTSLVAGAGVAYEAQLFPRAAGSAPRSAI